jgi:hypothetical protein
MKTENNNNNNDSRLEKLLGVTESNSNHMTVVLHKMSIYDQLIGEHTTSLHNVTNDISALKTDMTDLKLNTEITEEQAIRINNAVKRRINEILSKDDYEKAKYFRTFCIRCYTEMRTYGMGAGYRRTKKRDYQKVMSNIEAWEPTIGTKNLKSYIDEKALVNKKAKENGY